MMKSHPGRSRKLPLRVATILASIAVALGEDAPDFFDIIGKSPGELAASMAGPYQYEESELLLSGMVGTPMSRQHREQLLNELQETVKKESPGLLQTLLLAKLLEENGRFDEALTILQKLAPASNTRRVQETSLLWKAGKTKEAGNLAAEIPNPASLETNWLSLVAVDLNKRQPEEAMRLLTFLDSLSFLPPRVRYSLAIQHLSIARSLGESDQLIASTSSPVLRAIWHIQLDRHAKALDCIAELGSSPSAGDVALLALTMPNQTAVFEKARELLRSDNKISTENRIAILEPFDSQKRVELWIEMPSGHEETAKCVDPQIAGVSSPLRERLLERCLEIVKAHPESTRLKWIAARLGSPETPETKTMLREVARAFRDEPDSYLKGADPAQSALESLIEQSSAEELHEILLDAPGFAELPPHVRLRYLMAANLDFDAIELIKTSSFDEPQQDALSSSIRGYLQQRDYAQVIPDNVLDVLIERLPELVLGSQGKTESAIRYDASSWLTFLGTKIADKSRLSDAVNRLLERAGQRNAAAREKVLGALPAFVWSIPDIQATRPEQKSPPVAPEPPLYRVASVFSPSDPAKVGQHDRIGAIPSGLHASLWTDPRGGMRFLVSSPWTQNLRGIEDRRQFDPAVQAKLRKLFNAQPSRTLIYDLLVSSGRIECPDAEVKAAAEQRVAGLVPSREDDPAIAFYLFYQRLSKGAALADCLPLLDDLKSFPRSARIRLMNINSMADQFGEGEVLREKLFSSPAGPTEQPAPPQAPDPYDRLQFFIEGRQQASDEAVKLAKDVLSTFVDSGQSELSSTENIAIASLASAKRFTEFIDELKSRMEAAGKSELDVQRAFFRLHRYYIIHHNGESEPFAKRVFELDPTDKQAAWEVLGMASRNGDSAVALKCLEVLARESPSRLAAALKPRDGSYGSGTSPTPLNLFIGDRTRELVNTLMRVPLPTEKPGTGFQSYETLTLAPLYLHVARHDPEHLKLLMKWGRELSVANARQLLSLAKDLKAMQREALALDLLVEALFGTPVTNSPSKFRFPSKTTNLVPNLSNFPLPELASSGWAKQLAQTAEGHVRSDSNDGLRVLIALAADPRPETWDLLVPPFLAILPIAAQPEMRRLLESQAERLNESPTLKLHLTKRRSENTSSPATLDSLMQKLRLASQAVDRSMLAPLWKEAEPLLEKAQARERLAFLVTSVSGFMSLAEPEVWSKFMAVSAKTEGFAKEWASRWDRLPQGSISPDRIADLARLVIPAIQPDERNLATVLQLFAPLATAESPDLELLKQFRPWIEESNRRNSLPPQLPVEFQWIDLLSADPVAACPLVDAHPDVQGGWTVGWTLAGYRDTRQGYPSARAFPFLEGQFDLEILAGTDPQRMKRKMTIPKTAVMGAVRLNLADNEKFIGALITQRSGDIVRWSSPLELDSSQSGESVWIKSEAIGDSLGKASPIQVRTRGPFGASFGWEVELPSGGDVELARLPWEEGPAPMVHGWLLTDPNAGSLLLSFRDVDGKELGTSVLNAGENRLGSLPFWQRFKTRADQNVPADTATISLVFKGHIANAALSFRLADVHAVPPTPIQLPAGFSQIGRIPGSIARFALGPKGKRLAVASHRAGVGIFDLTTGQFSGWIPIGTDRNLALLSGLALSGDRIVCAETTGEIYLVSLAKRTARMIRKTEDRSNFSGSGNPFELSPDGRFLAWRGIMAGLRIAELGDEGIISERLIETLQLQALHFDEEKKVLMALGGENLYSLPLGDWQKAYLKAERISKFPAWPEPTSSSEQGQYWTDAAHQVNFRVGSENIQPFDPRSRTVMLPPGMVIGDGNGLPLYISPFGRVVRIDTEKLEGYVPPAQK